jgi:hypothetical protein
MRTHHSIVEIGMAAIPASVPSLFFSPRTAGALPPRKTPAEPMQNQRKNFAKPQQNPPSSTPVNPKNFFVGARLPSQPAKIRLKPFARNLERFFL